jgi:tetratricopeptide (TPR) repeat protein
MKTLSLLTIFLLLPSLVLAATVGKVTNSKGSVFYRSGATASYLPLDTGKGVAEGGWLKTGRNGWVELTLSDGSRFTLANDTELEVASFAVGTQKREGAFNLAGGKLRAAVVKLAGKQTDIKVRSATAVAGIKGTEFLMLSRGPANVLFGAEGTVAVSSTDGGSEPLAADMLVQTTRGYRPLTPVKVEPGTPLARARESFGEATGATPPAAWGEADALGEIIARWNINHGHYLADSGRFDEALHAFQLALDLTDEAGIRGDALLERGTVYGRFLRNPEAALAEYLLVLERYPELPQAETALFTAGQIQYQMGLSEQARARFRQYLERYPAGRYRGSAETLLKLLEKP